VIVGKNQMEMEPQLLNLLTVVKHERVVEETSIFGPYGPVIVERFVVIASIVVFDIEAIGDL
jgi:hypothetical protein